MALAAAWVVPAASAASPARIAIVSVKDRAAGVAITWRAAASGRYVVWVGATYCGGGVRVAEGTYRAPALRTVVVRPDDVPPGARVRVCLRTAAGVLSDARAAPNEPSRRERALALLVAAVAVATAMLFPGRRRRTNLRTAAATGSPRPTSPIPRRWRPTYSTSGERKRDLLRKQVNAAANVLCAGRGEGLRIDHDERYLQHHRYSEAAIAAVMLAMSRCHVEHWRDGSTDHGLLLTDDEVDAAIDAGYVGSGVDLRLRLLPSVSARNGDARGTKEGAMPQKGDVHVVPADEGWRVEIEGSGRAHSTHSTQAAAAKTAREVARRNQSKLLVHGRNGRIRRQTAYGADPRRSKG